MVKLRGEDVSLFIDGLPREMTWDWLEQIFRGEGEISNVFISHKRRSKSDDRFGFVRFKRLEEAERAIRNLNGIKIRDNYIKVSFAKYDKRGMLWDGPWLRSDIKSQVAMSREEISMASAVKGRSFKEVVSGMPHSPKVDEWAGDNQEKLVSPDTGKNSRRGDMMSLKGMIWKVMDEIFRPTIMGEMRQKLQGVVNEVVDAIQREEEIVMDSSNCMMEDEEQRRKGGDERVGAFWEEELVQSMIHQNQEDVRCPIGERESLQALEASIQLCAVVGPGGKSTEEAMQCIGLDQQNHLLLLDATRASELGHIESRCSGPECPPGFEDFLDASRAPQDQNQEQGVSARFIEHENILEMRFETDQNSGEPYCSSSVEKVPQTPLFESESLWQREENEIVMPVEEDLVEAQITWDLGKTLGLQVENEKAVVTALAKIRDCQDFVLPRKRGRPRKKKAIT